MVRLPKALEQKLEKLFPRATERNAFVKDAIESALASANTTDETMPELVGGTLHLFTDGGSRGNPGQAAVGCVLENPHTGETVREYFDRIGIETNNVAEYRALIEGLKLSKNYHPQFLICHLDSELVVKQVKGEYKVKMPTLQPLLEEILSLSQHFNAVEFKHIPRSHNHRADALVNKALDSLPVPTYTKPTGYA